MPERTIVVIDDHGVFAEALELSLSLRGHQVDRLDPGRLASLDALVRAVTHRSAGLVLLDLDLGPLGSGLGAIRPLAAAGTAVLVVTGDDDRARWGECLAAGARGVVHKGVALPDVLRAVRLTLEGRPVHEREERARLLAAAGARRADDGETHRRLQSLSPRERVVLAHLLAGRTVAEVASLETLSVATVRTQVKAVLAKLGVSSQLAAVGLAHRVGWRGPRTTTGIPNRGGKRSRVSTGTELGRSPHS
ncbi:response regulator [Nocardioides sp. GY 10127]|uniref:helix-turn-helix transcriptional regulator n=1 Tax=Nocardioides sp. GY 10127 TaxID=2569762 RepID=UPI0010A93852|nr:response regulator [Nocardioides sp. GY 10127]TIC81846.1 response regulator transcription factor [Nocardioides sp. GY 10127]